MDDVSIFRTTIRIENPGRLGVFETVANVMVDTGSEYTWVPRRVLDALELVPLRTARFIAADGREIEREVCFANIYAANTSAPDIVVFAEPKDHSLLGVRALEGMNLRVDVRNKQFVEAGPIPVVALEPSFSSP